MATATKVLESIRLRHPDLLDTKEDWERSEQLLRLAALLHDVGHAPYSHASEDLFPKDDLTNKRFKHEDYTRELVLHSELAEIIDGEFAALGITADEVMDVYSGDPSAIGPVGILLQDIVAGELDADRMDYLARDSLYAGVSYGRYDLDRLLDTVTAVEDRDNQLHLAIQEGGLPALEAFLLARYYMFIQVYLHEDRRFYDLALTKCLRTILKSEQRESYPKPENWPEFLKLDDVWVQNRLPELASEGNVWAKCLYDRSHWRVVQKLDTSDPRADQVGWTNIQHEVIAELGEDTVVLDDARAKTFQRTDPGPYIARQAERTERPHILVAMMDGDRLAEDVSELIHQLSQKRLRIMRLYARPDRRDEVLSCWQKHAGE
jgi:HD superfamily phosphohydrolase